jgi:DNA-binding response OmpR family regulator
MSTQKPNILLVEDDPSFGSLLRDFLRMNEFDVELCVDGEAGLDAFNRHSHDLCILDVMMPKKDGFSLAEEIRRKDQNIPIIFLTAKTLREDVLKGYQTGGDDYITKPFDSEILLHKVNAILKRNQSENSREKQTTFNIGTLIYHTETRDLKAPGETIKLSPKEGELLRLLCIHENRVLSRSKALKSIWKDENYFTGRSMDVYITKLRKFLTIDPNVEIQNIHSEGFMLTVKE